MSMAVIFTLIGGVLMLLVWWAFWFAPSLGQERLEEAQRGAMIALHTLTALAIVSAGIFYLEEQQWSPRFGVELKTDARLVPDSNPESALIQLAIEINNKTETRQSVNFIDVSAAGIRGALRRDPRAPQEVAATEIYHVVTTRPIEAGANETTYQFVEIPVPCTWRLVRVTVRVPRPPVSVEHPRIGYERKVLVQLSDVCGKEG